MHMHKHALDRMHTDTPPTSEYANYLYIQRRYCCSTLGLEDMLSEDALDALRALAHVISTNHRRQGLFYTSISRVQLAQHPCEDRRPGILPLALPPRLAGRRPQGQRQRNAAHPQRLIHPVPQQRRAGGRQGG